MNIEEESDKIPFMLMEQIGINEQLKVELDKKDKIIKNAKQWIENTMNDSHIVGCNLGDLQMLLDILESED